MENKAQVRLPEAGQLVLGHGADLVLADEHLAFGGLFQPGQLVEQRRFAAAGLADDTAELALFHIDIHVVQGHHALFAHGIDLAQPHSADDRHRPPSLLLALTAGRDLALSYHTPRAIGRALHVNFSPPGADLHDAWRFAQNFHVTAPCNYGILVVVSGVPLRRQAAGRGRHEPAVSSAQCSAGLFQKCFKSSVSADTLWL